MAFDGRWKLSKYSTGERLLFDLENDPHEQRNLIADPSAAGDLRASGRRADARDHALRRAVATTTAASTPSTSRRASNSAKKAGSAPTRMPLE